MGKLTNWLTAPPRALTAAARDLPVGPPSPQRLASPWQDDSILQSVTFAGLWPLEYVPVTRSTVIAIPAVARGRDQICITTGRLPLLAQTSAGRLAIQPGICEQPEAGRPRSTTMTWTVDAMLFHGKAWWLVTDRNPADNRPRQVVWVPPWCAEELDGQLVQAFNRPVDPADVIRFDAPHEGILTRSAKLWQRIHRVTASIDRQADNPVPSIELHQTTPDTMSNTEVQELVDQWSTARRSRNGGVGFTNSAIQLIPHGLPAEQLLSELGSRLDLETARALGLPAWAIDATPGGSNLTYSNPWGRARELIDYSLGGYLQAIADRLSLDDILPHGTWCTFDTDPLTDGDFADRMTAGATAVSAGIYTAEQIKAREAGLPMETTEGDE